MKKYIKNFSIRLLILLDFFKLKKLSVSECIIIGNYYFNKKLCIKNLKKSLLYFEKAVNIKPSKYFFLRLLEKISYLKDYKLQQKYWDKFIELNYLNTPSDKKLYSEFLCRISKFEEFYKYYKERFLIKYYKMNAIPVYFTQIITPQWSGKEDLSDKTLFIHFEQGYGDNILMFGYMPRLVKLAKHVIFFVHNSLYNLLKDNEFGVEVICANVKDIKYISCDYIIPAMSIPSALNLNKDTISVEGNYLKADKQLIKKYKQKYCDNDKFKIGIAFKGIKNDLYKDIPLKELLPLTKLKNVQVYCLTLNLTQQEISLLKKYNIIHISRNFCDFTKTAAAIMNMDVVVSSDNVILNLAGALGKKTFGMFNYLCVQRWYNLSQEDSGWFKNVKPIINADWNEWKKSVKLLIKEIIKYQQGQYQ